MDSGGLEGNGIWLRKAPERAGRSSPLSRRRITEAAVDMLDEGGVEKLTMRALAQRLDVTATALYWHVACKEDVLDLAFDDIFGSVRIPAVSADWARDVEQLLLGWHAAMLRHPWSPSLVGRPLLGPNILARTEFLQAALVRGGLADRPLAVATRLLANHTIGAAMTGATWRRTHQPDIRAEARAHVAARSDLYPTLNEHGHLDDRWPDEELFVAGVRIILKAVTNGTDPDRARR